MSGDVLDHYPPTHRKLVELIRHYPETGIVSRDIWNLIGRECRNPEILKYLEERGLIRSQPTHNRRRGTRWFPVK